MKTDIEIAQEAKLADIREIAKRLGLAEEDISLYGKYKAKIPAQNQPKAKMILVTAINPTSAGEGKTTVSIGLADGLRRIGKNVCLALREPSLGPVFGIKGGAAGGGYAQVLPMEDINLHFTGDLHAITAANNLICAVVDNHLYFGNELGLKEIYFKRCMDMNDRSLRDIVIGRNRQGVERETGFDITAASEIMAILCLATDMEDLKKRIGNIIIGINEKGEYVYFRDFKAEGAVAALLKEAMNPNLVQTLEGTPAIVHGGPFANIAHGCNSIRATKTAMSLSDYTVTEAGFGADLGAEKFLDVKCRVAGIEPSCVVVVATVRALKLHGGALKENLGVEDLTALAAGIPNLAKHVENMVNVYRKPVVVAVNRFASDTQAEIALLTKAAEEMNVPVAFTDVFLKGGEGGMELAQKVVLECEKESKLCYSYQLDMPVKDKINAVVTRVYGGKGAEFSEVASRKIAELEAQGYGNLPVIIAKTQYSLSDDQTLLARPTDFTITVKDIVVKGGAGFIVAVAGKIMLMPGLSRHPAAERITVDADGKIDGLF
ncbi:MAG: formate--tetrahydrofolate ligase [Clostridia bacterium]|nr:formate--tetrahydrofolate ligase [Clostridia bacterium]